MRAIPYRLVLIATAAVAALVPVAAVPGAAHAAGPAVVTPAQSAIGSWRTTVTIPGRADSVVTLVFAPRHLVTITGPTGPDGKPLYVGAGLWKLAGDRLSFTVVHPVPAADGSLLGVIHGTQEGSIDGGTFQTTGESYLYKPDATVSGPNPVSMTGVRTAAR